VANYGINIDVKIKAGKLTNFNRVLDQTNEKIDKANAKIKGFASLIPGSIRPLTQSFNDLSAVVSKANAAFNKSTLGTPQAIQAARNLVKANEEFNIGLEKRAKLLEKVTFEMKMQQLAERGIRPRTAYSSPIGPMPMMTVNNNPRIMRNIAASQAARQDTNFGFGLAGDPIAKSIRRNQQKREKLLQKELRIRQNILQVEKLSLGIASAEQSTRAFGVSGGQIGPALPQGFRVRQQFKEGGLFGMPGGMRGRIKGGVGSALIGGGFPALFGAGGISSAFGAVAGGAGGALAPGGGFAASIFATAIAAQIEKAIAFNKAVDDLNVSIRATGGTSLFSSKQVAEFAKSLGMTKDEALEALKAFKQFEASARIALTRTFGSEATFDIFAGLKDNASLINALPGLSKELSLNQAQRALETLKTKGATAAEDQLLEGIINKNNEIIKQEAVKLNFLQRQLSKLNPLRGKGLSAIVSGSLTMEEAGEKRGEDALAEQRKQNIIALERLRIQREFNEELERQAIIKAPVDELNKLLDPLRQIDSLSKSIGDSFAESFKGIIRGSMSAQDALRNLFQRTADAFLDMAAQILAAQIRAGIMGLFGSMFGGMSSNPAGMRQQGVGASANILGRHSVGTSAMQPKLKFAEGGRPPVGRASLVGERGPELFVPDNAGTIIPNHAMGSTNIVVNVDASGSNVEGDEEQGRELGRLISAAVQSEIIQQKRPGGLLA
jgi:hypothetical protein